MGHLITLTVVGFVLALLRAFVVRDLYACAENLQRAALRFASNLLPASKREEHFDQWYGDLCALPKSEIRRFWFAAGCIWGAIDIRSFFNSLEQPPQNSNEVDPDRELKVRVVGPLTWEDVQDTEWSVEIVAHHAARMYNSVEEIGEEYDGYEYRWCDDCGSYHDDEYCPYR